MMRDGSQRDAKKPTKKKPTNRSESNHATSRAAISDIRGEGEQNMLAAKFVLAAAIVNLIVLFAALAVNVSLASFG